MPISGYFEGHGEEVMRSIRKAHPGYGKKRVKEEFYRTANKLKMAARDDLAKKPKKH